MSTIQIFPQIMGVIALLFWIWSVQTKNKGKILAFQAVANAFYSAQYFLLGVISAGCMNLISILRSVKYNENYKKNKENSLFSLIFFAGLIIIIGIITFDNYLSLFPIIITLIYTYSTWQKSIKLIRISFIIAAIMWIYYNISVGAYTAIIGNLFELISGGIAIIRFDLKKKGNKNERRSN